ncbi:hypothetical protein [Pseudoduganella buxea]|uniref:hypothetical protein n=1 Tax=Pseudoduganella buxea TaxID=1949069 RepID=UPI001E343BB6|nr:hypothetical protein [Pseudoduganella buxea]
MDSQALLHLLALGNLVLAGVLWCHAAGRRGRGDLSAVLAARLCQGGAWLVPAWLGPMNDIVTAVFFIALTAGIAFEVAAFRQLAGGRIASRLLLQVFAVGALVVALAALLAGSVALPAQPGVLLAALFIVAAAPACCGGPWRRSTCCRCWPWLAASSFAAGPCRNCSSGAWTGPAATSTAPSSSSGRWWRSCWSCWSMPPAPCCWAATACKARWNACRWWTR